MNNVEQKISLLRQYAKNKDKSEEDKNEIEKKLQKKTKAENFEFIRERLSFAHTIQDQLRYVDEETFNREHRRFDMSGYENNIGECTLHNMGIVNEFADLGIYDYTEYLFLDFYKGSGTLYFRYFGKEKNQRIDFCGEKTVEIIYTIFQYTIFSNREKRRRR